MSIPPRGTPVPASCHIGLLPRTKSFNTSYFGILKSWNIVLVTVYVFLLYYQKILTSFCRNLRPFIKYLNLDQHQNPAYTITLFLGRYVSTGHKVLVTTWHIKGRKPLRFFNVPCIFKQGAPEPALTFFFVNVNKGWFGWTILWACDTIKSFCELWNLPRLSQSHTLSDAQ